MLFLIAGAMVGAIIGWLTWSEASCTSGGCVFSAHPLGSAVRGAVLGGLAGNVVGDLAGYFRQRRRSVEASGPTEEKTRVE
ncbi:MAG: hypothetical protein IPJ76_12195 [Flavobacteriales bacterium]|nr:MAG: hypothetical protein IPJ76_12195 [Flavobacteriales bacterium]